MSEPNHEHSDPDCLFCKIVAGEVQGDIVHQTDQTVAFRDVNPQAPTHILVVPRHHHPNAAALAEADPDVLAELVSTARVAAEGDGVGDAYRLVFNTGEGVGQSVFHVHVHVLGGRPMGWPPG